MQRRTVRASFPMFVLLLGSPVILAAQTSGGATGTSATTAAVPRQSGTVKAVTDHDLVLTNAAGQDFAVNLPSTVRVLLVDPATRDLKTARPGTIADIAGGDKAVVSGSTGDAGQTLTATRVLLLKSGAIAALHASEQAAWAHSLGGVVRSVEGGAGTLTVASGQHTVTVTTTPSTVVRRYAAGSVRFEDAVQSTVGAIQPGDQVQVRGQRSTDGATLAADEIVTGSFSNFSGTLTAIDATAGTVTLKDLATKKTVTVAVTSQTNMRRLPAGFAQGAAGRGTTAAGGSGSGAAATSESPRAPQASRAGMAENAGAAGAGGRGARQVLSRAVNHFPTETLGELKQGEAVMIVASNGSAGGNATAITLLSGVEQLITGSNAGQTTLTPWSLGGGEGEGGSEGGGGGGGR